MRWALSIDDSLHHRNRLVSIQVVVVEDDVEYERLTRGFIGLKIKIKSNRVESKLNWFSFFSSERDTRDIRNVFYVSPS